MSCKCAVQHTLTLPVHMWNEDFPYATFQSITLWQITISLLQLFSTY